MKRQEIIDRLVDNDINTIISEHERGDDSYVASIFEYGMKGYANFTDEELVIEYKEIFDEVIEIEYDLYCENCGWIGDKDELKSAMVDNEHNPQDHTLYETKVCPECGKDNFLE
jgi:Zn finger protein HypA/HybF involved in hydrogenase expression